MLPAGSAKVNVVAVVVMHGGLRQQCVVFHLGLADWGAVTGDDDQFGPSLPEAGEGLSKAEDVLSRLHDQLDF